MIPPEMLWQLRSMSICECSKWSRLYSGHLNVVAQSFNLLNHRNVSLLNMAFGSGNAPSSGFNAPIATSTAQRIQFSLDYEF
jgi:hypothetical protein